MGWLPLQRGAAATALSGWKELLLREPLPSFSSSLALKK